LEVNDSSSFTESGGEENPQVLSLASYKANSLKHRSRQQISKSQFTATMLPLFSTWENCCIFLLWQWFLFASFKRLALFPQNPIKSR